MTYWVLKSYSPDDAAYLSRLSSKMPDSFKFDKGVSLIDEYPPVEDCVVHYDDNYPDGTQLYGFLDNVSGLLIVSSEVRKIFEELGVASVEYLPIWLRDHKGNISSKDYTICNVLQSFDLIDMESSTYTMGALNPNQIKSIEELVLDEEAIPADAKVFRASKMLNRIFISDEVKEALESAGVEGFDIEEADGWDGL